MRTTPFASRSGFTSPLGKLDAELPKQKISGITLAELQRQAAQCGMPFAEWLRMKFDVMAFGADTMKRLHAERIDAVVGNGERKR